MERAFALSPPETGASSLVSLGRILFHLLQEYARHVGHFDIVRECVDGQTGE